MLHLPLFAAAAAFYEAAAKGCLAPAEVLVRIALGQGTGEATAWGSDLTEEFVRLNSEYTT